MSQYLQLHGKISGNIVRRNHLILYCRLQLLVYEINSADWLITDRQGRSQYFCSASPHCLDSEWNPNEIPKCRDNPIAVIIFYQTKYYAAHNRKEVYHLSSGFLSSDMSYCTFPSHSGCQSWYSGKSVTVSNNNGLFFLNLRVPILTAPQKL